MHRYAALTLAPLGLLGLLRCREPAARAPEPEATLRFDAADPRRCLPPADAVPGEYARLQFARPAEVELAHQRARLRCA